MKRYPNYERKTRRPAPPGTLCPHQCAHKHERWTYDLIAKAKAKAEQCPKSKKAKGLQAKMELGVAPEEGRLIAWPWPRRHE